MTVNVSYLKSLGIDQPEQYFADVLAVKATGVDEVRGYLTLWGDESRVDVEADYFTKGTDFWDGVLGLPRPLTWDHAQDGETKAAPVIGTIVEMGDDEIGRWYTAQLDRGHRYRKAIDKLIGARAIGTSSDSAPQYVVREKTGKSNWLKRWPLFAGALTTTPAEPRMIGSVDYFKSIGVDLTDKVAHQALHGWQQRAANLYRLEQELTLTI